MKRKKPQHDLFDLPDGPFDRPSTPFDTSEDAAESMRGAAQPLREIALVLIWRYKGLTQDEFQAMMHGNHQTTSPRFWELENRQLIVKSEAKRPTRTGRNAYVYQVTERGARFAEQLAAREVAP